MQGWGAEEPVEGVMGIGFRFLSLSVRRTLQHIHNHKRSRAMLGARFLSVPAGSRRNICPAT